MASYMALYSTIIFSILLLIPIAESRRCLRNSSFQEWQLNSSIPSDLYPSSNESNDIINQDCKVKLEIDFITGLVNVQFDAQKHSVQPRNQLDILTIFSLESTSKNVSITYTCSMSDYCDIDFLRETLSSTWATLQMESIRQELATRLYNSNNTGPVRCFNNNLCPQNTAFCSVTHSRTNGTSGGNEEVESGCTNLTDHEPIFVWLQTYTPLFTDRQSEIGVFYCNIPNCASNNTVIETFQWLTREYILPLNISILNVTTTTTQPTITITSTRESTTTTASYALNLFGQLNIVVLCSIIIVFFH